MSDQLLMFFYSDNPSEGLRDGTPISADVTNPFSFPDLSIVDNEESAPVKLALRCALGYKTTSPTKISFIGASSDKFSIAKDNHGSPGMWVSYGTPIFLPETVTDVNTIIWIKARAARGETPEVDRSTYLHATSDGQKG